MSSQKRQHGFLLLQDNVSAMDYIDIKCDLESIYTIVSKSAKEYGIENGCLSYPVNTSTYLTVCLRDGNVFFGIYDGTYVDLEGSAEDLRSIQQHTVFFNLCAQFRRTIMQIKNGRPPIKSALDKAWEQVITQRITINKPVEQKSTIVTEKAVTINSCHLSEETKVWLREAYDTEDNRIAVYPKNNSEFLVYVPENTLSLPPNLRECLAFAKRNECKMLCFDDNGPVIDELNTYAQEEHYHQQKVASWR